MVCVAKRVGGKCVGTIPEVVGHKGLRCSVYVHVPGEQSEATACSCKLERQRNS